MTPHDVRVAWRSLLRTPLTAGAAVLTLALGIGATTAICRRSGRASSRDGSSPTETAQAPPRSP